MISRPPSPTKLLRRLVMPKSVDGLESAGLEGLIQPEAGSPMVDARQRLAAAERLLKQLASGAPNVDEATIDRIIADGEEALKKLYGEGEH